MRILVRATDCADLQADAATVAARPDVRAAEAVRPPTTCETCESYRTESRSVPTASRRALLRLSDYAGLQAGGSGPAVAAGDGVMHLRARDGRAAGAPQEDANHSPPDGLSILAYHHTGGVCKDPATKSARQKGRLICNHFLSSTLTNSLV